MNYSDRETVSEKTVRIDGVDMTADALVDYCIDNKYIHMAEFGKKMTEKEWRIFFENILDEIQSDETALLCFAGYHNYKGAVNNSSYHAYILTDKRLISAGWYNKTSNAFNPFTPYSVIYKTLAQKHPKCRKDCVYLRDLKSVQTNMVKGHDVITFNTAQKSFNIMFCSSNVTHRLCDKINGILELAKRG